MAALRMFLATIVFASVLAPASAEPTLLVKSVRSIDIVHHTVVLPVHKGISNGKTVWYILTDVSDAAAAKTRGLSFAPLLAGVGTTMKVTLSGETWAFPAAPEFSDARTFTPGPAGFPPAAAAPGATAPKDYSPFVTLAASPAVYNAPIVATGDGPFDVTTHRNTAGRVLALDPAAGTVTLLLADGFAGGKHVYYISTEASDPGAATIERATYTPSIGASPPGARLRIIVIVNGQGQGLQYAALHGNLSLAATTATSASLGTSLNILGGLPAATPDGGVYDPLWNVEVGVWSAAAVDAKKNVLLTSADAVTNAVEAKLLTGPDGKAFGPAGFAVNCPVLAVGDATP